MHRNKINLLDKLLLYLFIFLFNYFTIYSFLFSFIPLLIYFSVNVNEGVCSDDALFIYLLLWQLQHSVFIIFWPRLTKLTNSITLITWPKCHLALIFTYIISTTMYFLVVYVVSGSSEGVFSNFDLTITV